MCGIAGVLHRDRELADARVLTRMADTLVHRGPDGGGVKALGPCGLAHRRLAIIDPTGAGAQPMSTDDGQVSVVFNGEIYNYRALRETLRARGCTFHSETDTEVLLHGWREWGTELFARLDGMFAFAIWDARERRLVLARDRTGKKPLFVYDDGRRVVFGSEMKAIFAHGGLDAALWEPALPLYLTYGYVPTPGTFYRRIRRLPAGSFQLFEGGPATPPQRYWSWPIAPRSVAEDARALTPRSTREAETELRSLFTEAVRKRLRSDVPLGALLSGGVDSTLVVGVMAALSSSRVRTFSIGFEGEPDYDETKHARQVAERFGTDHTEFRVQPDSFELIEKLAWHYDEPFGDSSAIPSYIVSRLSREHVKVVLTGDGGDELYAGYPRFLAAHLAEALPRSTAALAARLGDALPGAGNGRSALARVRRFAQSAAAPLPDRFRAWSAWFQLDELPALLSPELARLATRDLIGASFDEPLHAAREAGLTNRLLHLNATTYLLDDLNVKMDRASMAASLEARSPFLDTALIEHAFRLPGHMKLRGRTTKWILRRAFRDLIPPAIARRKKMGFSVPLTAWFRGELRSHLEDRLLSKQSALYPMLRRERVEQMHREHQSHARDWSGQLWLLSMLELWLSGRAAAHVPASGAHRTASLDPAPLHRRG